MIGGLDRLRRAGRALRFGLHVAEGLATAALVFPFISKPWRNRLIRRWSAGVLRILNVRLRVEGAPPGAQAGPVVFVANHISWLDPALILALHPAQFVAKAEIRDWPALGWLAAQAGTLFIERRRRHDTARLNRAIAEALAAGDWVGLFPEGTTTDGTAVRPFHTSLLQAAVQSEAALYPVALRYLDPAGDIDTTPAYIDDISFADSLWRILSRPAIEARVVFADPIPAQGQTRRELAQAAESAIRAIVSPA